MADDFECVDAGGHGEAREDARRAGRTRRPKSDAGGAMKIILGVDDSPCSEAAVAWIKSMAWPRDTQVIVVSVDPPPIGIYSEVYAPLSADVAVLMQEQTRLCQEIAARAEAAIADSGLRVTACVSRGDPRLVLVEAGRGEKADLIVVGSHGHTGIKRVILGSVAQYVVSHAPCPVVVVKSGLQAVA
jgi:nucleotide-binding universal stress UspA family protein